MTYYYTPIYCSLDRIAKRLRGRLNINPAEQYLPPPYQQSVTGQTVDPDLALEVVEQKEEFVSLILGQLYEMPLTGQHPVIEEIVESLVISELIRIHFMGQGYANNSSDLSGTGIDTKQHAYNLIGMLTAGHNIYIPGVPPAQNIPGIAIPQPVRLPGEVPRKYGNANDTITKQFTYMERRPKPTKGTDIVFLPETLP